MNDLMARLRAGVPRDLSRDRAALIGAAVSVLWVGLVLVFWLTGPTDVSATGLGRLASLVGVVMPLVLIWTAVGLARTLADLRAEAVMLRARMEALRPQERAAAEQDAPLPDTPGRAALAALRPAPPQTPAGQRPSPSRQGDLPLDTPPSVPPTTDELIAALNFPSGPDDHAAIAALRVALGDPATARAIRSAQDVITLLARHGIYMDDLPDAPADAGQWRRFLDGQRGGAPALAGIADQTALDTAAALMAQDEVFRDAGQHFLRQFDRTVTRFSAGMDDRALVAAMDTRSGRAFRLLAQVKGMLR